MWAIRNAGLALCVLCAPLLAQAADEKPRLVVQTGNGRISCVAFSPEGKRVITGSQDKTARLWDIETGRELRRFVGHEEELTSVACSPDGSRVLTSSRDTTARLWDVETGRELHRFGGHLAGLEHGDGVEVLESSAAFSPDGRRVLTSVRIWVDDRDADGDMTKSGVWDVETGEELQGDPSGVFPVAESVSPDGKRVLRHGPLSSVRGPARYTTVVLEDRETGEELQRFEGHSDPVTSVAFSPDGKRVLTGSGFDANNIRADGRRNDNTARLWDVETGEELQVFEGRSHALNSIALSLDGGRLLTGSFDHLARLWDLRSGRQLRQLEGHQNEVSGVAFSLDGNRVLTGSLDETVRLWDLTTGGRPQMTSPCRVWAALPSWITLPCGHADRCPQLDGAGAVSSIALSPDGTRVLTGGWNAGAALWDLATGRKVRDYTGGFSVSVAFSPDGKRALTGGHDKLARLWELDTDREPQRFEGHSGEVMSVVFSPDGERVLTAGGNPFRATGRDTTARLWDADTGRELRRFEGHTSHVLSAVFSPDGKRVLTGSNDNTARLWDAHSGKELRRFEGHAGLVMSVAFTPDGRHVLTAGWDTTTRVWDAETGKELAKLLSFDDGTWAVADPDGRFDASDGGDVAGMHWVVGMEVIALDQLKERYYEPGLLGKILGHNKERLRKVKEFSAPKLYPSVDVQQDGLVLTIRLQDRGGGIGPVVILVNGKERTDDARKPGADASAREMTIVEDLTGDPRLLPGDKNDIEVFAYNQEGYLRSRGLETDFVATGTKAKTRLWAIVAGVSDYRGERLDLRFAAKDAEDFAAALRAASEKLFGADDIEVKLLKDTKKKELVDALEALSGSASSADILVLYLAGHGVNRGEDFFYLTSEAADAELTDPAVRESTTVSSKELTQAIKKIPALKQVLILDTCASGGFIKSLTDSRAVPSSQLRALDRVKDRTGMFVLAGCAADRVSYEASRYGQGLLTYSLLFGMKGGALRKEEFVDVAKLFGFAADNVPTFAEDIGGSQRPVFVQPRGGGSFDVGRLDTAGKVSIALQTPRPLVLRASFGDEVDILDTLELGKIVNDRLRDISARGRTAPLVFVDASGLPSAYRLAGRYQIAGDTVKVSVALARGTDRRRFTVEGTKTDLAQLARRIVDETQRQVALDSAE